LKRSDFSDEGWGKILCDRYDQLAEHHAAGLIDEHPAEAFNRDSATLRRVARDAAGNVASSKEIEELDHTADDPSELAGTPDPHRAASTAGSSPRPGAALAAHDRAAQKRADDAALEDARIRQSGSATMEADLWAARVRREKSDGGRSAAKLIEGYGRLK
jgi:hypothetical protein